jgi:hypothetical protein
MAADNRYYKRYNFQSIPMEDYEVRDLARRAEAPDLRTTAAQWDTASGTRNPTACSAATARATPARPARALNLSSRRSIEPPMIVLLTESKTTSALEESRIYNSPRSLWGKSNHRWAEMPDEGWAAGVAEVRQ